MGITHSTKETGFFAESAICNAPFGKNPVSGLPCVIPEYLCASVSTVSTPSDRILPMPTAQTEFPESVEIKPLPSWQIELLYDGQCPLCVREVNFLKKRDGGRGLVAFVDIAEDDYNPEAHGGIDYETAMGRIHAVLPDGTTIKNVEVFRRIYEILGMGWIYAVTKLP
ncbi:MAG: DUF393 domain-containing protein, partial [Microcoleus sp.]